jgi:hypothetical protein
VLLFGGLRDNHHEPHDPVLPRMELTGSCHGRGRWDGGIGGGAPQGIGKVTVQGKAAVSWWGMRDAARVDGWWRVGDAAATVAMLHGGSMEVTRCSFLVASIRIWCSSTSRASLW